MIDGLATATMVASTRIMKKPTNIAHRAFHGFSPASGECFRGSSCSRTPPRARPSCRVVSGLNISGRLGKQRFGRRYGTGYAPTSPGSTSNDASDWFRDGVAGDVVLAFGGRHADRQ